MALEKHEVTIDTRQWDAMSNEDHAAIATAIMEQLVNKAHELQDLYISLTKTYGLEMGVTGISVILNIDSPSFKGTDDNCFCCLGTLEGITFNLPRIVSSTKKMTLEMIKEQMHNGTAG